MSNTLEQKTNLVGFPKAGELIEITGAHELETQDRAVLNLLYQHAHDSGRLGEVGVEWELPMAALRPSRHESNDRLHDSLRRLLRVVVTVPFLSAKDGEPRLVETHLFDFFDLSANEHTGNATVRFGLPKKLQPVLARSSRWGRIKAETVCAMTSKYAIALYELVQLRAGMDRCIETFPVARFRDLMGVPPGKLLRGPDFLRYCIEPAVLVIGADALPVEVLAGVLLAAVEQSKDPEAVARWTERGQAFFQQGGRRGKKQTPDDAAPGPADHNGTAPAPGRAA